MTNRLQALLAVSMFVAMLHACDTQPTRKCTSHYQDVREMGYCDMGPNRARDLRMP